MSEFTANMKSFFKGLIDLAIRLIASPDDVFRTMPKAGGLLEPLFFVVLAASLGVVLTAVESFVTHGAGINDLAMLAGGLVIAPLIAAILRFFVAGRFFAILSFMGCH